MDGKLSRNFISAVVIVAMVAGAFMLPALNDNYAVNAATKKVKVKYKANGGKFTQKKYAKKSTVTKKVKKGKKRGTAPKVTKTGYKLKGWYTKKTKGKKTTAKTKMKKSRTLYARWTANTYKVNLKYQNGQADGQISVKYDSKYTALTAPARTGYTFKGWFTEPKGGTEVKSTDVHKIAGDVTLYAQWIIVMDKTFYSFIGKTFDQLENHDPVYLKYRNEAKCMPAEYDQQNISNIIKFQPQFFFIGYTEQLTKDIVLSQFGIDWERYAMPNEENASMYYFKDGNTFVYLVEMDGNLNMAVSSLAPAEFLLNMGK